MTTEQKIRKAYEKAVGDNPYVVSYISFKAGYLALLNSSLYKDYEYGCVYSRKE